MPASFLDWLMGRQAMKKAADPLAATSQPLPTQQASTAQTDLARQIAANPNNQPQRQPPPEKKPVSNRWPRAGAQQ